MYIPAENVYYETIIKDESDDEKSLSAYALAKKVIPVSPNSLYAYLQAIVLGLKGLQIEKSAQYIIAQLAALQGDLKKFSDLFQTMGTHLTNARNKYEEAGHQLDQLSGKVALADRTAPPADDVRVSIDDRAIRP
jgi:DNA recombination protein RmuC